MSYLIPNPYITMFSMIFKVLIIIFVRRLNKWRFIKIKTKINKERYNNF